RGNRAAPLWLMFVGAHLVVAWLGWVLPSQPMGDVVLVYEPWSREALLGGGIVGVDREWVYPQLALLPMIAAQGLAAVFAAAGAELLTAYLLGWASLIILLDVLAFAVLLGRGEAASRRWGALFWIIAILLLGPI